MAQAVPKSSVGFRTVWSWDLRCEGAIPPEGGRFFDGAAMPADYLKQLQGVQVLALDVLGRASPLVGAAVELIVDSELVALTWTAGDGLARFMPNWPLEGRPFRLGVTAPLPVERAAVVLLGPLTLIGRGPPAFRRWEDGAWK